VKNSPLEFARCFNSVYVMWGIVLYTFIIRVRIVHETRIRPSQQFSPALADSLPYAVVTNSDMTSHSDGRPKEARMGGTTAADY